MLWLPDSMQSVYPIFYISQPKSIVPNTILNQVQPPPPLVEVDSELEYKILKILNFKIDQRRRNCNLLYLVCWSSYEGTDNKTSWLFATELCRSHLQACPSCHNCSFIFSSQSFPFIIPYSCYSSSLWPSRVQAYEGDTDISWTSLMYSELY